MKPADHVTVLLANRPRMLRESLRNMLVRQAGVEVETSTPEPVELLAAVDRLDPDAVFVTLPESGEDPGICSHLLAQFPRLLVIALSAIEQRALVYRQVITREELSPLAEDSILQVIRRQCDATLRFVDGAGEQREELPRKER
ncbi:MAG: hypothetical protein AAF560_25645 [Acidobacteriota bacterium]